MVQGGASAKSRSDASDLKTKEVDETFNRASQTVGQNEVSMHEVKAIQQAIHGANGPHIARINETNANNTREANVGLQHAQDAIDNWAVRLRESPAMVVPLDLPERKKGWLSQQIPTSRSYPKTRPGQTPNSGGRTWRFTLTGHTGGKVQCRC